MTIIEFDTTVDDMLGRLDQQIMALAEGGVEARYIIAGAAAYRALCRSISVRNRRGKGMYETYSHIPIVLDPFRDATICVVPAPAECVDGVATYRAEDS